MTLKVIYQEFHHESYNQGKPDWSSENIICYVDESISGPLNYQKIVDKCSKMSANAVDRNIDEAKVIEEIKKLGGIIVKQPKVQKIRVY